MAHYTTPRPAPQAKQTPLTEEEKKARIMQFLQQKRENFSLTILNGLCHNRGAGTDLVDRAVEMADALMEKLYPLPEEKPAEEKPVETDFD